MSNNNFLILLHSDSFVRLYATRMFTSRGSALLTYTQVRIAKSQMTHNPDSLETALPKANATVIVTFAFLQTYTGCRG